jgi:hypothetical protein
MQQQQMQRQQRQPLRQQTHLTQQVVCSRLLQSQSWQLLLAPVHSHWKQQQVAPRRNLSKAPRQVALLLLVQRRQKAAGPLLLLQLLMTLTVM